MARNAGKAGSAGMVRLCATELAVVERVGAATPLGYIWPCNPCVPVESSPFYQSKCQHTGRTAAGAFVAIVVQVHCLSSTSVRHECE